nr:PREDICTED: glutamate-rich protein 6B [Rhinolophus sinicus]
MSAEANQPSGGSSPLRSPTTFQQFTQTVSSEEDASEAEEESSQEESPLLKREEYPEEDEYLEKETRLNGKEYLCEQETLKEKEDLQKEESPEGKDYLTEEESLEREFKVASPQTPPDRHASNPAAGVSQMTAFLMAPPPISEPASERPYHDEMPSTSFVKDDGEFLGWRDQSTQTEWIYETKDTFWDSILNEPVGMLGAEVLDENLFHSSYQSMFRTVMEEIAARNELEEHTDIPPTGRLDSATRSKLGLLLKKDFEKFKKIILWTMKKRERKDSSDTCTFTFHLQNQSPQVEEPKVEEVKGPCHVVHHEKKLEIDTKWTKSKVKVPKGDVKLILYPNENIFQILFPDGSGQIHYPSGHLAMLILSTKERKFTYEYIVLEDGKKGCVRALINNTGHATFYDENGEIWLSLSQNLGYYFAKGKPQKAWNWWDLNLHVHAPPVQSISLNINQYIKVQIRRQDEIIFRFTHQTKCICLNLGTKYKLVIPEVLSEMKKVAILEEQVSSTAQKTRVLLGKMSRALNFLPVSDLENFLEATKIFLENNVSLREKCYFLG